MLFRKICILLRICSKALTYDFKTLICYVRNVISEIHGGSHIIKCTSLRHKKYHKEWNNKKQLAQAKVHIAFKASDARIDLLELWGTTQTYWGQCPVRSVRIVKLGKFWAFRLRSCIIHLCGDLPGLRRWKISMPVLLRASVASFQNSKSFFFQSDPKAMDVLFWRAANSSPHHDHVTEVIKELDTSILGFYRVLDLYIESSKVQEIDSSHVSVVFSDGRWISMWLFVLLHHRRYWFHSFNS